MSLRIQSEGYSDESEPDDKLSWKHRTVVVLSCPPTRDELSDLFHLVVHGVDDYEAVADDALEAILQTLWEQRYK